jgi:hypothetical protein
MHGETVKFSRMSLVGVRKISAIIFGKATQDCGCPGALSRIRKKLDCYILELR